MQKTRAIVAIAAGLLVPGVSLAQSCECGTRFGSKASHWLEFSASVPSSNVESASGSGYGLVTFVDLASWLGACGSPGWNKLVSFSDADASIDLFAENVAFTTYDPEPWLHNFMTNGTHATGDVWQSAAVMETSGIMRTLSHSYDCDGGADFHATFEMAFASVSGHWHFDGDPFLSPPLVIRTDFILESEAGGDSITDPCSCLWSGTVGDSTPQPSATFSRAIVTIYYDDETSSEHEVHGLLWNQDDSYGHHGFFDDESSIDAYMFGDTRIVEGTDIQVFQVIASSNIVSVALSLETETWNPLHGAGDIDQDEELCASDRAIIMGALGSSIGDAAYEPRADLNLDGEIDADDLAIFNTLPCNADLDCSGTVDSFDSLEFQDLYGAEDPMADFDGSGTINFFDYLAFSDAFNVGC
jgi:hypothetical protein